MKYDAKFIFEIEDLHKNLRKTQNRTSLIQPGDLNDEQNCSCEKNNHLFKNLSFIYIRSQCCDHRSKSNCWCYLLNIYQTFSLLRLL